MCFPRLSGIGATVVSLLALTESRRRGMSAVRVLSLAAGLLVSACEAQPIPAATEVVAWRPVGSWRGHGNAQTQSFTSDTGGFRVQWETKDEAAPGTGRFKVLFRSGDSGSVIIEAVDHRGIGRDSVYVGDRPRWYYLTIESANVHWSVTVEEPLIGRGVQSSNR